MTQANHIVYPLTEVVKATDGGRASEVAIHDNTGRLVGYWAYGYYDPELPITGKQHTEDYTHEQH